MVSELNKVLGYPVFVVLGLRQCRRCRCSYRIVIVHYACKKAHGLPKVWPPIFHSQYSPAHCTCRTDTIVNVLMMYTINTGLITGSVEISCRLFVRLRDSQHLYRTVFHSGDIFCAYRVPFFLLTALHSCSKYAAIPHSYIFLAVYFSLNKRKVPWFPS